jgi:hypothetical protein
MNMHVYREPDSQVAQPWNKGKLTGLSRLFARNMSGQ